MFDMNPAQILRLLRLLWVIPLLLQPAGIGAASVEGAGGCRGRPEALTMQVAMQDAGQQDTRQEMLQMLQVGQAERRSTHPRASPELLRTMPISWVNLPMSGPSFLNTLIGLPGVCPGLRNQTLISDVPSTEKQETITMDNFMQLYLNNLNSDETKSCPGLMNLDFMFTGIEDLPGFNAGSGHFMVMMRKPSQRILRAYTVMKSVFRAIPAELFMDPRTPWGGWYTYKLPTLQRYAWMAAGCVTRMLTRGSSPCGWAGGRTTQEDVRVAQERLEKGFAFVGMADQWALSMCLFSTMFKVPCTSNQFVNMYSTEDPLLAPVRHPEKELRVKDPYDDEVFATANKIFKSNLETYNVSVDSCQACLSQAGIDLRKAEAQNSILPQAADVLTALHVKPQDLQTMAMLNAQAMAALKMKPQDMMVMAAVNAKAMEALTEFMNERSNETSAQPAQ